MEPLEQFAGLAGSALSTGGNIISTMMTNQANKELWREQMAYNTPAEQRKRLIAGGYNPALALGHGTMANVAGSAPQMQSPQINDPSSSILASQQIENADAQIQYTNAIKRAALADARIKEHDADLIDKPVNKDVPSNAPWWSRFLGGIADRVRKMLPRAESDSVNDVVPDLNIPINKTWKK